jgi:hypothetical protein
MPDAVRALDEASAFLRQLIPLPGSGSVGPLSMPPLPVQGGAAQSDAVYSAAATVGEPAASIVSQAASVLDEEMARGVLAARSGSGAAAQGYPSSNAAHPVLRQLHDFVDNLSALWPNLQGGAGKGPSTYQPAGGDAEPLATVRPRAAVRPGERVAISMTLRNSESRPVRLVPAATDLLGSRGGRISISLFEFTPSEVALEPQQQKELVISATVPDEASPGCYSGLLVVTGLDYLRALVTIEVAGTTAAAESPQAPSPACTAATPGSTPNSSSMSRATMHLVDNPKSGPSWCGDGGGPDPRPQWNAMLPATRCDSVMQRAIELAEDGELGNSDAIGLLQMPHRPQDLKEVLAKFDKQLTREAKSKLTLEAFVPLPDGVGNQRYEPIFDRHPITGRTCTTASGTVVLSEVQYYNGEMVQLHGGAANVAGVREALAGSGYKPMTMRQADGRESAIVQFWSHQLTDTSLRPYDAMFVIVAAVRDDTPASRACIRADGNGASSVLPMFDGCFDPSRRAYENKAQLYFARLLDSTRVAVEVGRERMGTDKRPGTIELRKEGRQRTFSIRDGAGRAVARIRFVPTDDPLAYLPELAKAAATAGIPRCELPCGTEYVYPAVARIANGPIVRWQWRTDVAPRFQPVKPDTVLFDASSEEGHTLIKWGFEPKVLGYIANVRGVVTGIPESRC